MDATQAVTQAWLQSVAANPLLGALAMFLLIVATNFLRPYFASWGGGKPASTPETMEVLPRHWQQQMAGIGTGLHQQAEVIADHLKEHNALLRRQCEALERLERTFLERTAGLSFAAPPPKSAVAAARRGARDT